MGTTGLRSTSPRRCGGRSGGVRRAGGRHPEATAITFAGQSLTYAEVDAASNRLAHYLVDRGGSGAVCGVVVAALRRSDRGHLGGAQPKCGAAYVPIDPAHPDERIGFVLADAAPLVVITDAQLRSGWTHDGVAVVDIEDEGIAAQPGTPLPFPAPDDIAYVIYTSGTTGTPKGGG